VTSPLLRDIECVISSAVRSRLNGVFVAIGVSLGTALWATMAVSGMTALVAHYSYAGSIMQLTGGSYLVWLGIRSLLSATKHGSAPALERS
jgi:amino acid exporter